jgi:hypothetical protein
MGWRGVLLIVNEQQAPATVTLRVGGVESPVVMLKEGADAGGEVLNLTPVLAPDDSVTGIYKVKLPFTALVYRRVELTWQGESTGTQRGWLVVKAEASSGFQECDIRTSFFFEFRDQETGEVLESVAVFDQGLPDDKSMYRTIPVEMIERRDTAIAVLPRCALEPGECDGIKEHIYLLLLDQNGKWIRTSEKEFDHCEGVYVSQLFPEVERPFSGQLRVTGDYKDIYVTCLLMEWKKEGSWELTSIPSFHAGAAFRPPN